MRGRRQIVFLTVAGGAAAVMAMAAVQACSSTGGGGGVAPGGDAAGDDGGEAGSAADAQDGPLDAGAGDTSADAPADARDGWPPPPPLTPSGPIHIQAQDGGVLSGLKITSTTGDCVTIDSSWNVTIKASEIGPCAGNGVVVTGGGSITLQDDYIHPEHPPAQCCDTGDGVFATGTTNLSILGSVIAYGEANIEVQSTSGVHVVGNFLLNPQNGGSRGQNFQAWGGMSDVDVERNYALSSTDPKYTLPAKQEDSINFGQASGVVAKDNYVRGGLSPSGCGIIADDQADGVQFLGNVLVDTGQCGIGIASGTNQTVSGNEIYDTDPVDGGGNTGLYVWNQYSAACGPVSVTNNVVYAIKPDGTASAYWYGGGCDPVTFTGNVLDQAAEAQLSPPDQKLPPPPIPPVPVECVAPSPYANNGALPSCGVP